MVEIEIAKGETGADVVVDGNSSATFTKEHTAKPGEPFLAPPGAHASIAEAEAIEKRAWHR